MAGGDLRLLVAIPALDEAPTVGDVVRGIPREIPGIARVDVLVIDDGSSDDTARVARDAGAEVVTHATNRGLGVSFREAVESGRSRGTDILVNIDGDGQFDPADIPRIVAPIVEGRAAMVTASRFLDAKLVPEMPDIKRWGNHGVARIVALLTGRRFHDVSCGFRAFSREALLRMNLFGTFTYTQECFLDLVFKDLPIVEVPLEIRGVREHGTSRVASSIPRYAVRSLQIMLRAFISYRPFRVFACLAALFLAVGFGLLGFLLVHYLRTGQFSPHIWSGFVGGSFGFLGILTLVIGLIGDMLVRIRLDQDRILYHLRRAEWLEARRPADEA
ncbi:MAG: glycosyltransferase family 2 protein [Planctomycetes bacterium]|nr:glycosyltransferase family 2 protein [Planctomycetota bacterium]